MAVADGNEAWALFLTSSFEAVVSDWRMPGLDGIELARKVRAVSSAIPIIIQTSDPRGAARASTGVTGTRIVAFEDFLAEPGLLVPRGAATSEL